MRLDKAIRRIQNMIRRHHETGELPPYGERFRIVNYIAVLATELRRAERLLNEMDAPPTHMRQEKRTP